MTTVTTLEASAVTTVVVEVDAVVVHALLPTKMKTVLSRRLATRSPSTEAEVEANEVSSAVATGKAIAAIDGAEAKAGAGERTEVVKEVQLRTQTRCKLRADLRKPSLRQASSEAEASFSLRLQLKVLHFEQSGSNNNDAEGVEKGNAVYLQQDTQKNSIVL